MIPTREEWKLMVVALGYHSAVAALDCDLDDVPGIEETWLENFRAMADEFAESERAFLRRIKVI
jgi:hypothetical protein